MSSQSIYIYFLSASQLIFHLSFLPFKYFMLSLLAFIYNLLIIPELMVCYGHSAVTVLCPYVLLYCTHLTLMPSQHLWFEHTK